MIGTHPASQLDVALVGAGIMSATLGIFLKELAPALAVEMFEMLDGAALESSDAWNNAGTGHAANCELNYTPERSDGSIDISKALEDLSFDQYYDIRYKREAAYWHAEKLPFELTFFCSFGSLGTEGLITSLVARSHTRAA